MDRAREWWETGVLYQIYPRSFQDSDGDGIGDLAGVESRLDHLAWLGVDGIWLNPIHPSPNRDWGYDVADYLAVDPGLGDLSALDRLVESASSRGIRVILDLVPNHTSNRHPWFVEALSGRDAGYRDWYVWGDPSADGGPPNNWRSVFGGSAWTWEPRSGQFYLHNFLPEQPDLNWWNDDVRDEFDAILRFWFERGIAGFRIDVANAIVKDRFLRDDPSAPDGASTGGPSGAAAAGATVTEERVIYSMHRPEVHDVFRRWRRVASSYDPPRILIGETWARSLGDLARYYGAGEGLHLAFNFAFATSPLSAAALREVIEATDRALGSGAWPLWTASNHDIGRLATHWADGNAARARCALFVLLLLRGTPVLYAGDEIGLPDIGVPEARRRDPGSRPDGRGRDGGRTPMIWEPGPGYGFTREGVEPWLPFGTGHRSVKEQREDPGSVLSWCRRLIAFRRSLSEPHVAQELMGSPEGVLTWRRGSVVATVNLSPGSVSVPVPASASEPSWEVVLAGDPILEGQASGSVELGPWGCAVLAGGRR